MRSNLKWHWVDWLMFAIFAGWYVGGVVVTCLNPELLGPADLSLWQFITGMSICFFLPLLFWRPGYQWLAGFHLAVLLTIVPVNLYATLTAGQLAGLTVTPMMLVGYLSRGKLLWMTAPLFTVINPLAYMFIPGLGASDVLLLLFNLNLVFGIGYSIHRIYESNMQMKNLLRQNEEQYKLIQNQNRALEQYARQVEELTLYEERNRLARELHDTVGHTFTSVIMGMDAVGCLMDTDPDKARNKLEVLRNVTRIGLEEVRNSIHQIAPQERDETLYSQLSRIAGEFSAHTGTQVRIQTLGTPEEVSKQMKLALIRCLQEALTNAKRHGQAGNVSVSLLFQTGRVVLIVEDDGVGARELQEGFGLAAMRERVASLQGALHLHSRPGEGTTLTCTLPLRPPNMHEEDDSNGPH